MKKNVLIIDESPLLREYLKSKLLENELDVDVETAGNGLEGVSKMRLAYPDLILLDYPMGNNAYMNVLTEKKNSPNSSKIPVILMAQKIDQQKILALIPYGVKKVFTKPFKVDALFKTISEILGVKYTIDESPGIVDAHVNDDIIFIELAHGLNNDKLDVLYYKIKELSELYEIKIPRMIIMLSNLNLKGAEIHKLETLLNLLLKVSKAKRRNLLLLTNDGQIKKFVAGQQEYAEFKIVSTLQEAMDFLYAGVKAPAPESATATVGETEGGAEAEVLEDIPDTEEPGHHILNAGDSRTAGDLLFRFDMESYGSMSPENLKAAIRNLRIAAVDDDAIILELIKNTFATVGARIKTYQSGTEFLNDPEKNLFDLVFLDLIMPEMDGFTVLKQLRDQNYQTPVIVLSAQSKREMVAKAFQMGVKSYLIKPINPDEVFKKTIEILKANF
ncbi:response regulator [Treponema primitia]|uniref:response regulator n=1 Tax=Treponema primitia TaxID=88058 RepID=UPI0002555921|nr:response regulator [Treponema primitia]